MTRRRGNALLAAEDVDPIAFVPNLFDAILVLTVTALVASAAARARATERHVPPDPQQLQGFVDSGVRRAGQGERLGVAYRLADGRVVYVPEPHGAGAAGR